MNSILIVDDNEVDQFICARIIKLALPGVAITQAYDGEEALGMLDKGIKPDLILLDINMPRMNGHEFLAHYTRRSDYSMPPIVAMLTSSDQPEDREKAAAYECVQEYITKPMSKDNIHALGQKLAQMRA